jgi:hypothetical protein
MQAENTRPPTARLSVEIFEDNRMKMSPHLLDSPDIAPPDFSLFGCLGGCSFVNAERLLKQFDGFITASKSDFANGVSRVVDRLRKCIQTNGKHTE